ncbi:MAG: shikimate dehydrogenase [Rikenellaceae bacterium]
MKKLGLIGFPLGHSFSARYFNAKFGCEPLKEWSYENFPIENIEMVKDVIIENPTLQGFNVTIPHKVAIIPFLTEIDPTAKRIGAVNCVKILSDGKLKGYNTDIIGFRKSLTDMIGSSRPNALVLGSGGASKAVCTALADMNIDYQLVSRKSSSSAISYQELTDSIIESHKLIINTTPLGMSPNIDLYPDINYDAITPKHFIFDLIFNPSETKFMQKARLQKATVKNGYQMLVQQADAWWAIVSGLSF